MYQSTYRSQQVYRQQDVMGASPIRLVVMAYDLAICACEQKDFEKAAKTISALRDSLDFDYPEVAVGLLKLYQWCLARIRKGDYASALDVLKELRSAWNESEESLADSRKGAFVSSSMPEYAGVGRFA